jgi:uncharacterized membrane protein YidH (DUF202 family)
MALFSLIFWGFVLVVGAIAVLVAFLALWLPTIYALKVRRKKLATMIAVLAVGVVYVAGIIVLLHWSTQPARVFEDTFDMPPTADVVDLRSEMWVFADSGHVYLQFTCEPATVATLTASVGVTRTSPNDSLIARDGSPVWWNPPLQTSSVEYYHSALPRFDFASEEAFMAYDRTTQQVNYYWSGVD